MRFGIEFGRWAICAAIGLGATGIAGAQTVTYSLGADSDLLDADFYDGPDNISGNTDDLIIMNFGVSNSGTEGTFWGVNVASFTQSLFKVQIGDSSTWVQLTAPESADYDQIVYSPDDSSVFFGSRRYVFATQQFQEVSIGGYSTDEATVTNIAGNNWLVSASTDILALNDSQIVYLPILPNGSEDISRSPVVVTAFPFTRPVGQSPIDSAWVSGDGTKVAFQLWDTSTNPDISDVYMVKNVDAILTASKIPSTDISSLAPTSLADPNVVEIFATQSTNFVSVPSISQDGDLVFFNQDLNNAFDFENFFASLAAGDWDIMLANADGSGDVQFALAGNQAVVKPFPTGSRFTFVKSVLGPIDLHAVATTLTAENDLDAESDPLPQGGTTAVINGNTEPLPFTLTDSAVQLTTPVTVEDSSGTTIALPDDQVINFPVGSGATGITIVTPIDPVAPIQLPDPQTAIPVIRDFGPDGTYFYPSITVTISYTDAEVADIVNESLMIPYLYDSGSGTFEPLCDENDTVCLAGIVVDTVNNTLSFQTDHFSMYGIGGEYRAPSLPQRAWAVWVLAMMVGVVGLLFVGRGMRKTG